jgi:hypothetical protein
VVDLEAVMLGKWTGVYRRAKPFPHIVLDHALNSWLIDRASAVFPGKGDLPWYLYDNPFEKKLAFDRVAEMPGPLSDLISYLQTPVFVWFLEQLTGICKFLIDETCRGGGLHAIERGGKLDVHADFNVHPVSGLHRRLNLILFLNREWRREWGGDLQLWTSDMSRCAVRVAPVYNRMVVFTVTDTAFHGHPEPLACPPGVLRKSIALYYYTRERPAEEMSAAHSTRYQRRPGDPYDPAIEALREARGKKRLADAVLAGSNGQAVGHVFNVPGSGHVENVPHERESC